MNLQTQNCVFSGTPCSDYKLLWKEASKRRKEAFKGRKEVSNVQGKEGRKLQRKEWKEASKERKLSRNGRKEASKDRKKGSFQDRNEGSFQEKEGRQEDSKGRLQKKIMVFSDIEIKCMSESG